MQGCPAADALFLALEGLRPGGVVPSEGSAREVLSSDTQVPPSGPACDQGLPPVCTGHHWAARGLLYHVHPPGGPGDFHRAPPQAERHSLRGLRAGLPRDCRQPLSYSHLRTDGAASAAFGNIDSGSTQPIVFSSTFTWNIRCSRDGFSFSCHKLPYNKK